MKDVFREALVSAYSSPVMSLITVALVAAMCASVLLTSGRTVGAQEKVLRSIDSVGSRSIIVRASPEAGLTVDVLSRLANISGIESAAAFSAAFDAHNTSIPGGNRVAVRKVWSDNFANLGIDLEMGIRDQVLYASKLALDNLGMVDNVGSARLIDSSDVFAVAGPIALPQSFSSLEPALFLPQATGSPNKSVALLVVTATEPVLLQAVQTAVSSVLALEDPSKATLETSGDVAELSSLVDSQLSLFGRGLTAGVLGLSGVLTAAVLFASVNQRRKDFGRRRALGASQRLIVGLLVSQTTVLALVGSVLGLVVGACALLSTKDPLPSVTYFVGLGLIAISVAILSCLLPALFAARREPIVELRVP